MMMMVAARSVVLVMLPQVFAVSTTGHYGDTRCEQLHTSTIQHSDAHCIGGEEGAKRSPSCSAVVSFDLSQELHVHDARVTPKSAARGFRGAVAENVGVGLSVVHSQGPAGDQKSVGPVGRLPSKLWEEYGNGGGNGMAYSIATRVVAQDPGPSKLQVQVRYGDTVEDMLENVPNPADSPEWSSAPSSHQIFKGGREIMIDVMFCFPANDRPAKGLGFRYESPSLQHRADVSPLQRGGQTARMKGRAEPTSLASSLKKELLSRFSGRRTDSRGESLFRTQGATALRGGGVRGLSVESSGTDDVEVDADQARDLAVETTSATDSDDVDLGVVDTLADLSSCDPFDGGDEWCEAAISSAEQRALDIQETGMYCSRECDDHGALWCNIFGKPNCRMCSHDCEAYCLGETDCACHPCPVSGATETWACTVGRPSACYDQISESDYKSMVISQQRMQCTSACLTDGGFWCQAMGIDGCRFCSLDCDEFCSSNRTVFGLNCDCVQCPDDLEDSPFESTDEEYQSCADADDGDAFCLEQAAEETRVGLEAQGMGIECHKECYPGVAWPIGCFAEETVGCRYCRESCDEICGQGVPECTSCYTCNTSYYSSDQGSE